MERTCPILDRVATVDETSFCRDLWSIVQCRETGFVFLADPPDYSQLETEFAWEKTSVVEKERRNAAEPVISAVSSLIKKAKSALYPHRNKIASLAIEIMRAQDPAKQLGLLDIGCGAGGLMVEIHNRFTKPGRSVVLFGVEVSRHLATRTEEKLAPLGGRVVCANAIDGSSELEPASIHVAVMSSFLEHECQPLRLLKQLYPILTSDGAIVLKVPNLACWNRVVRGRKWCGFRFPDHVNYFTPKTLQKLAQEAGYNVSRQNLLDKFPLSDNMYAILTKS